MRWYFSEGNEIKGKKFEEREVFIFETFKLESIGKSRKWVLTKGKGREKREEVVSEFVAKTILENLKFQYHLIVEYYKDKNDVIYKKYDTGLVIKNKGNYCIPSILSDKNIAKYNVRFLITKWYASDDGNYLSSLLTDVNVNGELVYKMTPEEFDKIVNGAEVDYFTIPEYYFVSKNERVFDEYNEELDFSNFEKYFKKIGVEW